jgi:phosphatidylserine/phosphatidylglycerophosphate/cardiolipin synthase-like enzyme
MAKRKTTGSNKSSTSPTTTLLAVVVLLVLIAISRLTGIDLLGLDSTPTPVATPTWTPAPPTLPPGTPVAAAPGEVSMFSFPRAVGAAKGFWQVYFTQPSGTSDPATYNGGIDIAATAALAAVQSTLDIAAYEFNNPVLTQAVLDAKARGVRVRIVSDDVDGLGDANTTLHQFEAAGIPVVTDQRGDLMHNKFMILDGTEVWTGSWNYTINDTYRNNNNALVLRSQRVVQNYQTEFDEMFAEGQFGPRSRANTPNQTFTQDGVPIAVYFAPEDEVVPAMVEAVNTAQESVRFMAFSFTLDDVAQAMLARATAGVNVEGIFETTGSETRFSELTPLFCAGLDVRQDGNPYILHHKVIIIDGRTVVTGSFNFSASATDSNDENLVIIQDPDLAAQYLAEFDRRWAEAVRPTRITCN